MLNYIKDGGFRYSSTLDSWTVVDAVIAYGNIFDASCCRIEPDGYIKQNISKSDTKACKLYVEYGYDDYALPADKDIVNTADPAIVILTFRYGYPDGSIGIFTVETFPLNFIASKLDFYSVEVDITDVINEEIRILDNDKGDRLLLASIEIRNPCNSSLEIYEVRLVDENVVFNHPPVCCASLTNIADLSGVGDIIGNYETEAEDRILLVGQTDKKENGIWVVKSGGWERPPDYVNSILINAGSKIYVRFGSSGGSTFYQITDQPVIGTNNIDIGTDWKQTLISNNKITVSATEPTSPSVGDVWIDIT